MDVIYDAIVVGTGGIGSAALYHLAGHGANVLGVDRYPPGHEHGSSHGHTRIIRQAYFEHPDYVPLLRRAYALWEELQQAAGQQLYFPVGILQVGPPAGGVVEGVLTAAQIHDLAVDRLSVDDVSRRYPAFRLPAASVAVYERNAGYLLVRECIIACHRLAIDRGAAIRTGVTCQGWESLPDGTMRVHTDDGAFTARSVILTAGAWAPGLLQHTRWKFEVLRKHVYWFRGNAEAMADGYPACLFELPYGTFYALPQIDGKGVKVANHSGGDPVSDPGSLDQAADPADRAKVERFVREHLGLRSELTHREVCMYTMSEDGHFVVGADPSTPNVYLAAGLSGHGFKFASVLGETLAQLALEGRTEHPIEFLGHRRLRTGAVTADT